MTERRDTESTNPSQEQRGYRVPPQPPREQPKPAESEKPKE
jgi:hypothetical protein